MTYILVLVREGVEGEGEGCSACQPPRGRHELHSPAAGEKARVVAEMELFSTKGKF